MASVVTNMYEVHARPQAPQPIQVIKGATIAASSDTVIYDPSEVNNNVVLKNFKVSEGTAANVTWKQRGQALTGTVATTASSPTITGTSTTFTSDYGVGDEIVITDGDTLTVQTVDSDTQITATGNATSTVSGKTHKRQETLFTEELIANQGVRGYVHPQSWDIQTEQGYALVLNPSAEITSMLFHVQESDGEIHK